MWHLNTPLVLHFSKNVSWNTCSVLIVPTDSYILGHDSELPGKTDLIWLNINDEWLEYLA